VFAFGNGEIREEDTLALRSLTIVGAVAGTGALLVGAFSAMNAACSASSSSTISADTACADNAQAVCAKMATCTPANLIAGYGPMQTCVSRLNQACLGQLGAPSTGAAADKTEACAKEYANYQCADYRNKANFPPDCVQATGSLANGSPCEYPGQCQSGFCAIVPGSACGSCAAAPKEGDSCAQLTSCGQTLTCTGDTLVCVTPAAANAACGVGVPCGAGLACVAPGGMGTAGTCQPAGSQPGAACDGTLKTGGNCDGPLGLYCDGITKQCATTAYADGGAPCGYDVDGGTLVECTAGTCVGANAAARILGLCAARAADQGACLVPDGGASTPSAGCIPSARCIAANGAAPTCLIPIAANCH
jgi:hypothetical protein